MADWADDHLAAQHARAEAAQVRGRHYSSHVAEVKALKRAGDSDGAAALLLLLVEAIEREAAIPLAGHDCAAPWYFEELAKIYRRSGQERQAELIMLRHQVADAKASAGSAKAMRRIHDGVHREVRASEPAPEPAPPAMRPSKQAVAVGRVVGRLARHIINRLRW
jgi:hypothetical protein